MLYKLLLAVKVFFTLRTLKHPVHRCRLSSSPAVLLGMVHESMLFQLVGSRKPSATVTDVRSSVAVQDEVVGQFRRCLELHVAPRTVKQFDGDDVVHLHRLQIH